MVSKELRHTEMDAGDERGHTSNASAQAKPIKLCTFIFGEESKHLLYQAVCQHNAHPAAHSEKDETFEIVKDTLVQNLSEHVWRRYHKPTTKTVRYKLRYRIWEHLQRNKGINTMSGVKKVSGLVKEILDKFIKEINQLMEVL